MNLKINFAVCHHFLPCAMARHTAKLPFFAVCLSTWHTAKVALFAVCLGQGTRQRGCVCRVPSRYGTRQTGCSTGLRQCTLFCRGPNNAHGKVFAVCPRCSTRQTSSLPAVVCRELFAVCYTRQTLRRVLHSANTLLSVNRPWHTANRHSPVV